VADRSGDSAVFEWYHGRLKVTRKRGPYQLMTNFLLTDPKAGGYPCPRYVADTNILNKAAGPNLETCRQVLEMTSAATTRYSLLCDLTHGDVHVFLRRRFDGSKTIHLADELKKGRHELDLDKWFGQPKPEPLAPPPVIAKSTIPAAEIIQRSLAARGGEKAAANIRSIHGKGTIDILDATCLRALPTEFFAARPDGYRLVLDLAPPDGPNLGQYREGFDGSIGWNINPDTSCRILRGKEYDGRKDGASFFGWYDVPGGYESAECLGQAEFNGKLCYDIREVSKTHTEYFEYYDATNFLLVGVFSHLPKKEGAVWVKTGFGDYQPFDGFLMPLRFDSQNDAGGSTFQLSSLEINTLTNLPPVPALAQLDSKTYGQYMGQYRMSFLFGLIHFGPTLSISCGTNKQSDCLVASVRSSQKSAGNDSGNFFPVQTNSFIVDPEITTDKIQLTFVRPRNGKTTRAIVNWNGKTLSGARISD
jgi:hypothetical protein